MREQDLRSFENKLQNEFKYRAIVNLMMQGLIVVVTNVVYR